MDAIQKSLLEQVAELHDVPEGAYNIRANGKAVARNTTAHIDIVSKTDKDGIDIIIKPGTKNESVHIPVVLSESGLTETVYNDFFIGEGADVTIVAGCGVHADGEEEARHNGIHRFFLAKGARVLYKEKHIGTGKGAGAKRIDPVTQITMEDDAYFEMDTVQLSGVDDTTRTTSAVLGARARLVVRERLMTNGAETAMTDFDVALNGEDAGADLVSRSVARGHSRQTFRSCIRGKTRCTGHSECDAILADEGCVIATPALEASHVDASLIHEAAIGKIAGEQLLKLCTLGLTEEEAERKIIEGFLR